VLCCAVLCCAVLCCAVLCCVVLCCAMLCCVVLCCAMLYCAALYFVTLVSRCSCYIDGLPWSDDILFQQQQPMLLPFRNLSSPFSINCCIYVSNNPSAPLSLLSFFLPFLHSPPPRSPVNTSGSLRPDVPTLGNVQYVCGLIQNEAAQSAMRAVEPICRGVGAGVGDCDGLVHLEGDRDRTNGASHHHYVGHTAAPSCNSTGGPEGEGPSSRAKSVLHSASLSLGLRVAVCDVNIGAATAADLICKYVLPHMERACVCRCGSSSSNAGSRGASTTSSSSSSGSGTSGDNGSCDRGECTSSGVSNDPVHESLPTPSTTTTPSPRPKPSSSPYPSSISSLQSRRTATHFNEYNNPQETNCTCCGYIVLTLKLVKNAKESYITRAVEAACGLLTESGCWDYRVVHLGANSRNERTLVCRYGGARREG
jgi:hypothetical protein